MDFTDEVTFLKTPRDNEPNTMSTTSSNALELRDIVKDFNPRHYFLFNRVAFWWNRLPDDVAQANNVISFKVRLDKWVKTKNFINY